MKRSTIAFVPPSVGFSQMWRRKALRENPYLNRKEFSEESRRRREQTIADWFHNRGSQAFINWLENSYRTHQDRAIEWDEPFFRALAELLGNPWLQRVIVIKAAQLGFSELLIALCGFTLTRLRSPCLFAVERANKRPDAGSRIQKTFDFTREIAEYRDRAKTKRKRQDTDTKTEGVEVAGVPLHLRAVAKSDDSAGVDPKLSSFPAEILVADEIERWPQGALDAICQRSSRSSLPNPLILRAGSTPGGEGGITNTAVRLSSHFFDWQVRCSHCQQLQFLHPFGNVARATEVSVFNVEALPEGCVLVFPVALKETGWQPFGDNESTASMYFGGLESVGFGRCQVTLGGEGFVSSKEQLKNEEKQ